MPSLFTLGLIDYPRKPTQMSLAGPDYASDGSDKPSLDTLWDNLSVELGSITQGTKALESIASTYDKVDNPATPDSGAIRKQEWVFNYRVPAMGKDFITSIGTADTDDVDTTVVDGNVRLSGTDFTGLETAWNAIVKHVDDSGMAQDTELLTVTFRTRS